MADMDKIRRMVQDAETQQHGTQDERLAAFRAQMEQVLTPEVIETFGMQFGWDTHIDMPVARFELPKVGGWVRPSKDGSAGTLEVIGKPTPTFRYERPFDTKEQFLLPFKGWL